MPKVAFLSILSALLLLVLPAVLGARVEGYHAGRFISELGALDMPGRSLANGAFFLIGAFWMGTVEAARKHLEPERFDPWVRFGMIAFAANYIASVVFPCDLGCPVTGGATQLVHNTLVWVLYAGGVVAGVRLHAPHGRVPRRLLKAALVVCFLLMQAATWERAWQPGWWQRGYELTLVVLWLAWIRALVRRPAA